ncbi:MAG: DUF4105 domain-containing protein [Bacteroidaceae bacterium]
MKKTLFLVRYLSVCVLLCGFATLGVAQEDAISNKPTLVSSEQHYNENPQRIAFDPLEVSLLTCSPGKEIYAYYGHTALRILDYNTGVDAVFNYGMFSFGAPHFIWRFMKGETDYELGVLPFDLFLQEYSRRGSFIEQQILNLRPTEKSTLYQNLIENSKAENCMYRYNILYDNCTTRARNMIEQSISGHVSYATHKSQTSTYRDIIHRYTTAYPWSEFGQDLLLGAEADRPIERELQEFAPFVLMENMAHASIVDREGISRPLVLKTLRIDPLTKRAEEVPSTLTPLLSMWLLFGVLLVISLWEIKRKHRLWGIDAFLFGLLGLIGCAVTLLFFFSEHPTVGSNWLILLLNPLPLLYLPRLIFLGKKQQKDPFYGIEGCLIVLLIAFYGAIPQKFPVAIVPLVLSLLLRIISHLYLLYNKK